MAINLEGGGEVMPLKKDCGFLYQCKNDEASLAEEVCTDDAE